MRSGLRSLGSAFGRFRDVFVWGPDQQVTERRPFSAKARASLRLARALGVPRGAGLRQESPQPAPQPENDRRPSECTADEDREPEDGPFSGLSERQSDPHGQPYLTGGEGRSFSVKVSAPVQSCSGCGHPDRRGDRCPPALGQEITSLPVGHATSLVTTPGQAVS